MTGFTTQTGNGEYRLQFETDNRELFQLMQETARRCVDGKAILTWNAAQVVHGRWIVLAEFLDRTICTQCSVCGEEYTYKHGKLDFINAEYARYNFCPNCGAKMDGDGND